MAKAATDEQGRPVITERQLKSLLSEGRKAKQNITDINTAFGGQVKEAIENKHLDHRAFRIIRGLDRLEPEKLRDTLDNLEHYLDIAGLNERAASAPRLEMEGGEGEEEGDEQGSDPAPKRRRGRPRKDEASNVSQFPQAAE